MDLTLDQKITLKGALARYGVDPRWMVRMDVSLALRLWYWAAGTPLKCAFTRKRWFSRRRRASQS